MLTDNYLQTLLKLDRSSSKFPDQLCAVLDRTEFSDYIAGLESDDLLEFVEYLDKALDDLDPTAVAFRGALRKLQGICASRSVLPSSHVLSMDRLEVEEEPFASGGYSDVYKGILSGLHVCVKGLRMLYREAVIWTRLTHPNIVPFKGVTLDPLQIVSERMLGGDLTEYIRGYPQANRVHLSIDVAKGLHYLHYYDVIHGDLKGSNVLVDDFGCARIADFGLSRNQKIASQATMSHGHTARWTAPEIMDREGAVSKEADVFAFAMVMVEVFTGTVPFNLHTSVMAMFDIMKGKRPRRPPHPDLTDGVWRLMERCWDQEPRSRPQMSDVLQVLRNLDRQCCSSLDLELVPNLWLPDHNPQTEYKSRNLFPVHLDEVIPGNHGPLLPPAHQDQQDAPQETRKHAGVRTNAEHGGKQEEESQNVLENILDGSLHRTRPQLDPPAPATRLNNPDHLNSPAWKQLTSRTLAADERILLIATIFSDRNEVEMVQRLSGNNAQTFIDTIDEVLDSLAPEIRKSCSRVMYTLCGHQALLPRSLKIPLCYDPTEPPLYHGGFTDVWKGRHRGQEVAAKVSRAYNASDLGEIRKRFCKEAMVWRALRHPNVLPLLGVTMAGRRLVMVSAWMVKDNIVEFVKANVEADRLKLLGDVARGLAYMHDQGIVHGDLKGVNILINDSGRACIHDFGQVTIVSNQSTPIFSPAEGGTLRWMSPELIDPESFGLNEGYPTKESDSYALGMVVYEVLSGQVPFAELMDTEVIQAVVNGMYPARPQGDEGKLFTDAMWGVTMLCLEATPGNRPSAEAVLLDLEGNQPLLLPTSHASGGVEKESDGQSDTVAGDSKPPIVHGENGRLVPPPPNMIGPDPTNLPTNHGDNEILAPPQSNTGVFPPSDPLEHSSEDTWDYAEDTPEPTPSNSSGRFILSSSTLVHAQGRIGRFFASSHHSGNSTSKHDSSKSRRKRVKKHVRHLLHLPDHAPATVETIEKPKPETLIDQREEIVYVSNDSVPYLLSRPIPTGKSLKKVVITVISKDQGWSRYKSDHGTYQNSWTWFELSVGSGSGEKWRGEVVRNLHAHGEFKEHAIEITAGELYEKAEGGDVLTVWALAKFSGWKNTVKKIKIRYVVE